MKSLYLCYFGLREPLVQTQVLPYLRQIGFGGVDTSLLTFEPRMRSCWSRGEIEDWSSRLSSERIRWFSLPYHKRPTLPATLYDIARGALLASRIARSRAWTSCMRAAMSPPPWVSWPSASVAAA